MKLPAKARAATGWRAHAAEVQSDAASSDAASGTPSEDSHDSNVPEAACVATPPPPPRSRAPSLAAHGLSAHE